MGWGSARQRFTASRLISHSTGRRPETRSYPSRDSSAATSQRNRVCTFVQGSSQCRRTRKPALARSHPYPRSPTQARRCELIGKVQNPPMPLNSELFAGGMRLQRSAEHPLDPQYKRHSCGVRSRLAEPLRTTRYRVSCPLGQVKEQLRSLAAQQFKGMP
jgi:hypothetical protein